MRGHGRPKQLDHRWLLALIPPVVLAMLPARLSAQGGSTPDELLADAELCDVYFVDPDRGWAVGERGVVRHTDDGGRHWRLQSTPVACRLESVFFLDDQNGWIVGGWTRPYTHKSSGVVLRTFDGGEHWERIPRLSLPALRRVKFFDGRRGWAVGDASDMYPAGVFQTEDGGLSWYSVPARGTSRWLTGDTFSPQTGAVGGRGGVVGGVTPGGSEIARSPALGLRNLRCMRFAPVDPTARGPLTVGQPPRIPFGWSVGDGGLALVSVDGGRSWHEPIGRMPHEVRQFDFHTVAVRGKACWIAGNPGTRMLHSADGGHSWKIFDTGQTLPIRAVMFLDDNRGWAVGSLGRILATRDGGRNWTVQRQGGDRAALLGIFAQPRSIPMELLVMLAGNEGYLSTVEILTSTSPTAPPSTRRSLEQRTRESVVAVGGTGAETAWRFPLRYDGLKLSAASIVADWDRVNAYGGRERLLEYVVGKIRMWRPEVVITEPPSLHGEDPLAQLVNQTVIAAVEKAADESFLPEDSTLSGLRSWQVKKVYSSLGPDAAGAINLTTSQLAPRLGCSLADRASRGQRLLRSDYEAPPHTYGFRLLVSRLTEDVTRNDFFGGISLPAGGGARRMHHAPPPGDLRSLTRSAQQRRNVDKLLHHLATSTTTGSAWLAQVENLVRGLELQAGGDVLFQVAQKLRDSGRPELAAEVYDLLIKRCAKHDSCDAALAWLVQYYASGEAAWGLARADVATNNAEVLPDTTDNATAIGAVNQAVFMQPAIAAVQPAVDPASHRVPISTARSQERSRRATLYGQLIQNSRPSLFAAPEVRFSLAGAHRSMGKRHEAEGYLHALSGSGLGDPWLSCARSELWLRQPTRRAPKQVAECVRTDQRPRLDGRLDDAVWSRCLPLPLTSPHADDAPWPAAVMLARDAEFLYLAASCRTAPGVDYPTSDSPRPRDPDLTNRDRLELLIDVDRDYATFYRFAVDHRGWVREACLEVDAWDPEWYVAASQNADAWIAEVAIPLRQLAPATPGNQDAWAIGLHRIVPGVGFQSWTPSDSPRATPESLGLCLFP